MENLLVCALAHLSIQGPRIGRLVSILLRGSARGPDETQPQLCKEERHRLPSGDRPTRVFVDLTVDREKPSPNEPEAGVAQSDVFLRRMRRFPRVRHPSLQVAKHQEPLDPWCVGAHQAGLENQKLVLRRLRAGRRQTDRAYRKHALSPRFGSDRSNGANSFCHGSRKHRIFRDYASSVGGNR